MKATINGNTLQLDMTLLSAVALYNCLPNGHPVKETLYSVLGEPVVQTKAITKEEPDAEEERIYKECGAVLSKFKWSGSVFPVESAYLALQDKIPNTPVYHKVLRSLISCRAFIHDNSLE